MNDAELIVEAKNGNPKACRDLVKRFESRVAATVIGMLGSTPEADDVGQETFIRFFNSLDSFRGDAEVSTYLTRIAINLSLNEIKRRKRKSFLEFRDINDNDFSYDDKQSDGHQEEDKELINNAIQALKPDFRAVVVLRLIDGYTTSETSEILKIPVGTVLSRLARAQEKLKQILSPYFEVGDE
ncbi:MAG: RNA polymerase sigma factor [Calditrichaceae bacterium]